MTTAPGRRRVALLALPAILTAGLLTPVASASPPPGPNATERWNAVAGEAAVAACLSPGNDPLHESRMYAMASLAAHDALNAIDPRYEAYASRPTAAAGADPAAAVAAASRVALLATVAHLPDPFAGCGDAAIAVVEDAYAAELAQVPDGTAKDLGLAVGTAAAEAVVATRVGDGSDTPLIVDASGYEQGTEPGEWRFTPDRPFAFAPGWGEVRPFALRGAAAFHVAPAYPLQSTAYARDFAEVERLGGDGVATPSGRTPDQTQAALFWIESSPLQWNRIARTVAQDRTLDEWQAARLFSLLDMALADGYIASFSVKYDQAFWRPVTAIREADTDGNRRTAADPTWTPLDTTPPIPDHDSAHAVQGGAASTVLAGVLGSDAIAFSTCSTSLPAGQRCDDPTPTVRSYAGFSQAAVENANSRVWVGYHFRHASVVGLAHGRDIGDEVLRRMLPASRG